MHHAPRLFPFHRARRVALWLMVLPFHFAVADAAPRATVRTAKAGSAERNAVFDALRKPVTAFCKTAVTFTKADVKIGGNWAYVQAKTVDKSGKAVGIKEMQNYNSLEALLSREGKKWRVREWVYPSDVVSLDWAAKYSTVPKALWPHTRYKDIR